ncbi:NBS-LRR disease resistance protein [Rhynchospora pubera]|uniref:NBS-LRR disease resistance protein n=1 Tax=Rhynchospora pubera TaxID=906938 RepID=A0AAV8FQC3_9POAL|nr:NBS-LRR disease resistance protein [Rhynchospora pubera]
MEVLTVAATAALVKLMIEKLNQLWKDLIMFWDLDKECDITKDMLTIISIVLANIEKKFITNERICPWLSQLQDATYDVDDFLDDLQIEKQRRSKGKFPAGAVWDFLSSNNQVKFHYKMVKKIKRINTRLDKSMEEKRNFQLVERNFLMEEDISRRETFSIVDESSVYGRKEEKKKIINLLTKDKDKDILSVLPIVGIGGVGKTTLAKIVYNDKEIKEYFDRIIWVYVSMKFQLSKILEKIIECVSRKSCDVSYIEAKVNKLETMISGTRYLIVLDDVWNEDVIKWKELTTILKCVSTIGSKILVTTRSERVAKIVGTYDQFRVDPLEFEYCWKLFEELAFQYVDEEEKESFINIGKEIIRKCKGLPLAVVHMGNLAASMEVDWCIIRDSNIWQTTEYWDGIMALDTFPSSLLFPC